MAALPTSHGHPLPLAGTHRNARAAACTCAAGPRMLGGRRADLGRCVLTQAEDEEGRTALWSVKAPEKLRKGCGPPLLSGACLSCASFCGVAALPVCRLACKSEGSASRRGKAHLVASRACRCATHA